jgi:cation:H+ antiporter
MLFAQAGANALWLNGLIFLVAAIVVWGAGTRLTYYLDAISEKTGLGQALVGMLLLGGLTSLPEVANTISASSGGEPRLAVNNLLGSAAINVLLLAVVDAFVGKDAVTAVVAKPSTMMMSTLCMILLAAVAFAVTVDDVPVGGVGVASLAIATLCVLFLWLAASYEGRAKWRVDQPAAPATPEEPSVHSKRSLRWLVMSSAAAAAVIFFAGYTLSEIGGALAEQTGLGAGLVGFLLIGVSTSMPELSSIIAASRLRRYELAFGQVLGTNFINLSLILLADAIFVGGPVMNELGAFETMSALLGLAMIGTFQIGLLEHRNPTVIRMGYDSLVVMILFVAGVGMLYAVR